MKISFCNIIKQGDSRTILMKKNILGSFVAKVWNCIVQLLLVPVTLNCLTQYEYGIWLTLNSIFVWIDSFDIGLGNGLRNQLTKAIATNNWALGRKQVSTTFVMLCIIIIPIEVVLLYIIFHTDCYDFLNINPQIVPNLNGILAVTIAIIGTTFVFKIIGNIYLALQMPAINNIIVTLGQTLALGVIFFLSLTGRASLFGVAIAYAVSPLIIYILFYPITFRKYKELRPSIKLFNKKELKPLFGLGFKFFFIQISGMVIFTTSNIIISKIFSPTEVAPYQIANRYFGLTNILFTLISAPLWSATTDAYAKGDWNWILSTMKKMRIVLYIFFAIIIAMLLIANPIYAIWTGNKVIIPEILSIAMAAYMFFILYGTCYSNMLCGFGKVRLLTVVSIVQACIFLPLAIKLGQTYGVEGIVYALIITSSISALTNKIQFEKICSNKAQGIFNK